LFLKSAERSVSEAKHFSYLHVVKIGYLLKEFFKEGFFKRNILVV